MKTTPIFSIFLMMALFITGLNAQIVPPEKAKNIAQNLYMERALSLEGNASKTMQAELLAPIVVKENNDAAIYIFNEASGNGFVIMSAEQQAYPVLAYSFEGRFDLNNSFPAMDEWMEDYKNQIAAIRANGYAADQQIKEAWQRYEKPQRSAVRSVDYLVTSVWDQDCFYNELCPVDATGACGHARVGCVAVAMAQIMRYHQYPSQGTGSHSYTSSYGFLSADFGAATYEYSNMPDFITDYNYEVAELGYHCGVSVDMGYGPQGSGAYSSDVEYALINYFGYDPVSTQYLDKYSYTEEEWEQMIRDDLDAGRPLYYSGSGSGGHAFVLDGYQDGSHFHFNWGWGGLYNGYFYLSNLNPGTHNYSNSQAAIMGIQSANVPDVDFLVNHTEVLTGQTVDFTDLSTSNPTQWQWTFEGGAPASSSERNPQNIRYNATGTYKVSLTVWNAQGESTKVKNNFIEVSDDVLPSANFYVNDTVVYTDYTSLTFNNNSANGADNFKWTFEPSSVSFVSGTSSQSEEPRVKFEEATVYSVRLIASNANGSDTCTKEQYIYAGGFPVPFYENFELGAVFGDKWSIGNTDGSITWNGYYKLSGNGDSRKAAWMNFYEYTATGERDQIISPAINTTGHRQLFLDFVHAYATFNETRRDSLIIKVSTNAGSSWTRVAAYGEDGSGNFATHDPIDYSIFEPSVESDYCNNGYGSPCYTVDLSPWSGLPNVKIMFESWNGHGNSLYVDDVLVHDPGVYADFEAGETEFCETAIVDFFEQSRGEPTSYAWTFEGGSPATSDEQNPQGISYAAPGYYNVQLIVSNGEYSDTLIKTELIKVRTEPQQPAQPNAPAEVCQTSSNSFISVVPVQYAVSYNWEIDPINAGVISGNGTFAAINWNEEYSGNAELKVRAVNNCGQSAFSDAAMILIHESPQVNAGDDQSIQTGETCQLNASASGASGSYSFHWEPADLLVNPDVQQAVSHPLSQSAWFWVIATDADNACVSIADSVFVMVEGSVLSIDPTASPEEICFGQNSQLHTNADGGSGVYTYQWSSNPTGFESLEAQPIVSPIENTWYQVSVSDGVETIIDSVFIEVHALPEPDLGADVNLCENETITLDGGEGYLSYLWSNGSTERYLELTFNEYGYGSHDIWLELTNENNCSARDSVLVSFDVCSAIEEVNASQIELFPNPSEGVLNIVFPFNDACVLSIYSADGRLLQNIEDQKGQQIVLNTTDWPSGLYFVRILHNNTILNKRFIIK